MARRSPLEPRGSFFGEAMGGLGLHFRGIAGMKPAGGGGDVLAGRGLWGERGVFGQAMLGYRRGRGGGLMGAGSRLSQYLGVGFDPTTFLNKEGAIQTKAIKTAMPYFSTFQGGRKLAGRLMGMEGKVTSEMLGAELAPMMRGLSRRRWAAGGWAGAALVGAGTVGFGNIASVGMGYGVGAAFGAGAFAMAGRRATRMGRAAMGAKWGGRLGAVIQAGRIMFSD